MVAIPVTVFTQPSKRFFLHPSIPLNLYVGQWLFSHVASSFFRIVCRAYGLSGSAVHSLQKRGSTRNVVFVSRRVWGPAISPSALWERWESRSCFLRRLFQTACGNHLRNIAAGFLY